eukprot:TRINITY_DN56617_c0_g1_i1.p1 TRINITY_DN56617_c0_g1~~TRINITY_DN56617_c0_g1_i1.p1  ORF type:complete len:356 (+),score=91.74 TRINITY_DN56617_c0_g1_i1:53-1069(+)
MGESGHKRPPKAVQSSDTTANISKMLSWILRYGWKHKNVGLDANEGGWLKITDVLESDYFKDVSQELLMKVIVDSNSQKPRYQLSADCNLIRAYSANEKTKLKNADGGKAPVPHKAEDGSLRGDAPEFVPSQNPIAAPIVPMPGYPAAAYPWQQMMQMMMMPPFMHAPPVQVVGKGAPASAGIRETGKIKSFFEDKGYGFIECPRVQQQFGRDLFVHKAQLNGFKVGDEVSMSVTVNQAGHPQAKDLASATGQPAGGKGKGKGKDKGKGKEKGDGKDKGEGKSKEKAGSKGKGKAKGPKYEKKKKDDKDDAEAEKKEPVEAKKEDAAEANKEEPAAAP